jgi:hypothetical protein
VRVCVHRPMSLHCVITGVISSNLSIKMAAFKVSFFEGMISFQVPFLRVLITKCTK